MKKAPTNEKIDAGLILVTGKHLRSVLALRILSGLLANGDKTFPQCISIGKSNGFTPTDTREVVETLNAFDYISAYIDDSDRITLTITGKGVKALQEGADDE